MGRERGICREWLNEKSVHMINLFSGPNICRADFSKAPFISTLSRVWGGGLLRLVHKHLQACLLL